MLGDCSCFAQSASNHELQVFLQALQILEREPLEPRRRRHQVSADHAALLRRPNLHHRAGLLDNGFGLLRLFLAHTHHMRHYKPGPGKER